MKVRALILAAGAGRRYGGIKQLAEVSGRSMVARVVEAAGAWDPLVVLGAHAERVRPAVADADVVVCSTWAEGQSASLRAGVAALGAVDAAVVLLGDQPLITSELIADAVDRLGPGYDAVRTTYEGVPGHPVVLGRRVLDRAPELRGDTGARSLLAGSRVLVWEAGAGRDPGDVDTPQALQALRLR